MSSVFSTVNESCGWFYKFGAGGKIRTCWQGDNDGVFNVSEARPCNHFQPVELLEVFAVRMTVRNMFIVLLFGGFVLEYSGSCAEDDLS